MDGGYFLFISAILIPFTSYEKSGRVAGSH